MLSMLHLILQVDVRLDGTDPRGVVNFGLFRGDHSVQYRQIAIPRKQEESYYICELKLNMYIPPTEPHSQPFSQQEWNGMVW